MSIPPDGARDDDDNDGNRPALNALVATSPAPVREPIDDAGHIPSATHTQTIQLYFAWFKK